MSEDELGHLVEQCAATLTFDDADPDDEEPLTADELAEDLEDAAEQLFLLAVETMFADPAVMSFGGSRRSR